MVKALICGKDFLYFESESQHTGPRPKVRRSITEGIFGAEGLMLTSIFLIPQRMAMWSVGVSYFMHGAGAAPTTPEEKRAHRKAVILKTIRHPCIVAVSTALSLITTPLWCLVA